VSVDPGPPELVTEADDSPEGAEAPGSCWAFIPPEHDELVPLVELEELEERAAILEYQGGLTSEAPELRALETLISQRRSFWGRFRPMIGRLEGRVQSSLV
jgi:hypothetical protein